jgi:hypothetical protein
METSSFEMFSCYLEFWTMDRQMCRNPVILSVVHPLDSTSMGTVSPQFVFYVRWRNTQPHPNSSACYR